LADILGFFNPIRTHPVT